MEIASQITFLYYRDLDPPGRFFEETLGLTKVVDEGFARIYRVGRGSGAFIGIVDETQGHCNRPREKNVLITLVVDDIGPWYERLSADGVKITAAPKIHAKAKVECFFFEDPGGYAFEVQRFLDPATAERFGQA